MSPDQSSTQVATTASNSEGATTTADEMMGLEVDFGGGSRSTPLIEREC
jgi:hypothetical protein